MWLEPSPTYFAYDIYTDMISFINDFYKIISINGFRLLEQINADYLLISYPVYNIGGHKKGMIENYESWFREILRAKPWLVKRFEFSTELVFLVTKKGTGSS